MTGAHHPPTFQNRLPMSLTQFPSFSKLLFFVSSTPLSFFTMALVVRDPGLLSRFVSLSRFCMTFALMMRYGACTTSTQSHSIEDQLKNQLLGNGDGEAE